MRINKNPETEKIMTRLDRAIKLLNDSNVPVGETSEQDDPKDANIDLFTKEGKEYYIQLGKTYAILHCWHEEEGYLLTVAEGKNVIDIIDAVLQVK